MRKLHFMKILLLALTCFIAGCSNNSKTTEQFVLTRAYVMQESEDPMKPVVLLNENNKFSFTYSALSSYIAIGTYEVDNDNLVLKTDDGKYKYVFKIKDDCLIFNAKESSSFPSYANVPDGAIFK